VPKLALAELDWQAIATLITGALAVVGAVWIGLRQLAITRHQNDISAEQARLAELTLRDQLFDKRLAVYNGIAGFLGAIVRQRSFPSREIEVAFLSALGASRFLFSLPTYQGIQVIWDRALEFRVLKIRMRTPPKDNSARADQSKQEDDAVAWFFDRLQTLPDLFGEELRLS
jgi:hypothetical protein